MYHTSPILYSNNYKYNVIMLNNKYLFTFTLIIFLLISITGAGIFLDDEWTSAQQLKQLHQFHQISKNEGTYGYYANGTIGSYFEYRANYLMYSMALPIASSPIYLLFNIFSNFVREIVMIIWIISFIYIILYIYQINKRYGIFSILLLILLSIINIVLFKPFIYNSEYIPSEVLAIVVTNILMYGIFAIIIHKIIDELFDDNLRLKLFAFVTTLACSSLIFWVSACKDHILAVLIASIILLYLIYYVKYNSMLYLDFALLLIGVLIWIRIELGAGVLLSTVLYTIYYYKNDIISNIKYLLPSLLLGTTPLWINNILVTGSPFKHPFMIANAHYGLMSAEDFQAANIGTNDWIGVIFHFLFAPSSGALALMVITSISVVALVAYLCKPVKITRLEILLLCTAFVSSIYYIFVSTPLMHADMGIMPDMRYLIFFYTPLTLASVSILSRIYNNLNYKKIIIYIILLTGLLFILFTAYSASLSDNGTYRDLNRIVNTLSTITLGLGGICVINDIRLNTKYIEYVIPLIIAIPLAWQFIMMFIYHTSKVNAYPMLLPITEFIYNYVFGVII